MQRMDAFAWPICVTLLFLIIFLVVRFSFPEQVRELLGRMTGVNIGSDGIAVQFMAKAVEEKETKQVDRADLQTTAAQIEGPVRVLWVDDKPMNNRHEAQALRALGASIDFATSNAEALAYAGTGQYDLLLSDIGRRPPQGPTDGLALPGRLAAAGVLPPQVMYYIGHRDQATTPDGYPVYDRPTELFHALAKVVAKLRQA
jgi:hypothetical protein